MIERCVCRFVSALCVALTASGCGGPASDVAPDGPYEDPNKELVYAWTRTVHDRAVLEDRMQVTTLVDEMAAGAAFDAQRLTDEQGRRYEIVADTWQEAEDGPVKMQVNVYRWEPTGDNAIAPAKNNLALPALTVRVVPSLERWAQQASTGDSIHVLVSLNSTDDLRLPDIVDDPFRRALAPEPELLDKRARVIESRAELSRQHHAPLAELLTASGSELIESFWIVDAFHARITVAGLAALRAHPDVRLVESMTSHETDGDISHFRDYTQVEPIHGWGVKGGTPSGVHPGAQGMRIAVIDEEFDADHPAWGGRLDAYYMRSGGAFYDCLTTGWLTCPTSSGNSHGTRMAGLAASSHSWNSRRGYAPQAELVFIENDYWSLDSSVIEMDQWEADTIGAIQQAVAVNADVIVLAQSRKNTSALDGTEFCAPISALNEAVDQAMLDGVFFAKSAGSSVPSGNGSQCDVGLPGAASGAFVASGSNRNGTFPGNYGRGGDFGGRSIVALAPPAKYGVPSHDLDHGVAKFNGWGDFNGTSAATAQLGGAAALLKQNYVDNGFGSAIFNDVGNLYAGMLLMGDGTISGSYPSWGKAGGGLGMHPQWGAGQMKMRLFNSAGLDGPFRMRIITRTIEDGELSTDLYTNPNSSGVNQPLPTDAERLKVAVYWHEPNIEYSAGTFWAQIALRACPSTGSCIASTAPQDQHQRFTEWSNAGGKAWHLELEGINVPPSFNANYLPFRDERKVHVALYWEDTDRESWENLDGIE